MSRKYYKVGVDDPEADAIVCYHDHTFLPLMFHFAGECCNFRQIAEQNGFMLKVVAMADALDAENPLVIEYYESGSVEVVGKWQPSKLTGWDLVGKDNTEDGPVAYYIRPLAG